jgi:hypothetical protein
MANFNAVANCPFTQARFRPDVCAVGIILSSDQTTATLSTKKKENVWNTNVLLTRPPRGADGSYVVTWRHGGVDALYGWASPDLDPNTKDVYNTHASVVNAHDGTLHSGLGQPGSTLPGGKIAVGATLSLRYAPAQGMMHARVNGGDEHACFTSLPDDLVPAVCFFAQNNTCSIVD